MLVGSTGHCPGECLVKMDMVREAIDETGVARRDRDPIRHAGLLGEELKKRLVPFAQIFFALIRKNADAQGGQ